MVPILEQITGFPCSQMDLEKEHLCLPSARVLGEGGVGKAPRGGCNKGAQTLSGMYSP